MLPYLIIRRSMIIARSELSWIILSGNPTRDLEFEYDDVTSSAHNSINTFPKLKARHSDRTLQILNAFLPKRPYLVSLKWKSQVKNVLMRPRIFRISKRLA